jgi:ssRNA-specific RNase YbeY (16S rRNA maturation enzyme)
MSCQLWHTEGTGNIYHLLTTLLTLNNIYFNIKSITSTLYFMYRSYLTSSLTFMYIGTIIICRIIDKAL